MSLFARSDLMSLSVPSPQGCGATHTRPVTRGAPAKTWKLDCPDCESYLRGDGKPKIIKNIPGDRELGIPGRMERVPDCDPHWSSTPESIPLTPDELNVNKIRAEKGSQQLQQLQALAALQAAGLKIPDEAQWLLSQNFDPRIIKGTLVCHNGHENAAGSKFCQECGTSMETKGSLPSAEETEIEPKLDVNKLHVATLRKMCREKGLPDNGNKTLLIERLAA